MSGVTYGAHAIRGCRTGDAKTDRSVRRLILGLSIAAASLFGAVEILFCHRLGKLGAVVGTQVLPVLLDLGLSYVLGACLVTCVAGALLTQVCVEAKAYETVLLEADAGEGGVA